MGESLRSIPRHTANTLSSLCRKIMQEPKSEQITLLLHGVARGEDGATSRLINAVYDELQMMARGRVAREKPGNSVRTCDLVHETFMRVIGKDSPEFENRRHFFGAAAQAMRRVLIDHYRKVKARGGDWNRVPLEGVEIPSRLKSVNLPALDEALERFEQIDPRGYNVVLLRVFLDVSVEETAEVLGVSERTVRNDWVQAKAWLKRQTEKIQSETKDDAADEE